jgi:hypothetical protein
MKCGYSSCVMTDVITASLIHEAITTCKVDQTMKPKWTFVYGEVSVPGRVIRSQQARLTLPPGLVWMEKLCIDMCVVSVLFVLCLLVMHIWIDSQVLMIWDFGSTLKSGQAKPSQAKPSQQCRKPAGASLATQLEEDVGSVYFRKEARMDSFAAAPSMP